MSAESVSIYYGLRFQVQENEADDLHNETHPFQIKARQFGLDCDWGNFSAFDDDFCVLIGKEIGIMGVEYKWEQEISEAELFGFIEATKSTLKKAGFEDEPKLVMQLRPDF